MPTKDIKPNIKERLNLLGIVGIIVSVLLPPVGLLWCLILLTVILKKYRNVGIKQPVSGIVIGSLLSLPFIAIGLPLANVMSGGTLLPNSAKEHAASFVQSLESMGGKKIYDRGCGGSCIDNGNPFYIGVYSIPDTSDLTQKIKEAAKQSGYTLVLPSIESENSAYHAGVEEFESSELIETDLKVMIPGLKVGMYRGEDGHRAAESAFAAHADDLPTDPGSAIIYFDLTLSPN